MKKLVSPFLVALVLSLAAPALAVQPDEMLKDPAQEQRARDISQHLRCLVCQNQSIDDSDAGLARDLRLLVRERIEKGDSNSQVIDYLVARYGEFVLLKPRFSWQNAILWVAPALILLAGAIGFGVMLHRRRDAAELAATAPLSDEEKKKLAELTKG
ncbi:cytochrome C biogenesis protein [Rhodoplanes elegans]|uniref:Cytochrome c-type biogenesis protein n=1 Tax=Rhodoplanes elegans TaxID=29408 RepID=A0A327K2Y9_9BRAD|nr:cytochrome c-type biogenesis protein [Rhodoplanes elegans]MBK5959824.1 cytochrome C biogenesis protein [Rhodoplanes elegans]RAI32163.1 cytochrome C biogenesis protein [Rhodoplanes elegans]